MGTVLRFSSLVLIKLFGASSGTCEMEGGKRGNGASLF